MQINAERCKMTTYQDIDGDSSVLEYWTTANSITVKFSGVGNWGGITSNTYKWTNSSAGSINVSTMKWLAKNGEGLNEFINENVKSDYDSRWWQ